MVQITKQHAWRMAIDKQAEAGEGQTSQERPCAQKSPNASRGPLQISSCGVFCQKPAVAWMAYEVGRAQGHPSGSERRSGRRANRACAGSWTQGRGGADGCAGWPGGCPALTGRGLPERPQNTRDATRSAQSVGYAFA